MLRILRMIAANLTAATAAVRLPGMVPPPAGFRGRVKHDLPRCIGCGLCAYVCVSDAISVVQGEGSCTWRYDPGRCAFCGRCLERCPCETLTMQAQPLPPYHTAGELVASHEVPCPRCPDCGAPTRPATDELMRRAFPQLNEDALKMARRCERCRRRHIQRKLRPVPSESLKESKS